MPEREINSQLMDDAFVGLKPNAAQHRGKILRLLDGDFDKLNALAVEHGLDHASDYIHKGRPLLTESKALARPTRIQENDADAPKGSNPWKAEAGQTAWTPEQSKAQADLVRRMGLEHAQRVANSANSFVGAPRPGARDLTPRNGNRDTRVDPEIGKGSVR